jgi:hypothetical protein
MADLLKTFRNRLQSIINEDYQAAKEIVTAWSKEPEHSFLRRWS